MIDKINRQTIERVNKAIINTRAIAQSAKREHREEAKQRGEFIVSDLNMFRQYCQVNANMPFYSDTYTTFKRSEPTARTFLLTIENLKSLMMLLSVRARKAKQEEARQVMLLLQDIIAWARRNLQVGGNHA